MFCSLDPLNVPERVMVQTALPAVNAPQQRRTVDPDYLLEFLEHHLNCLLIVRGFVTPTNKRSK